jgi:hypothetical protein
MGNEGKNSDHLKVIELREIDESFLPTHKDG